MYAWATANWVPLTVGAVLGILAASGLGCKVMLNLVKLVRTWAEVSTILAGSLEKTDATRVKRAVKADSDEASPAVAETISFLAQTLDAGKKDPETPRQFRGRLGRLLLGRVLDRALRK